MTKPLDPEVMLGLFGATSKEHREALLAAVRNKVDEIRGAIMAAHGAQPTDAERIDGLLQVIAAVSIAVEALNDQAEREADYRREQRERE